VLDQVGYIVFGILDAVGWPLYPFIFVGPVGCIVLASLDAVDVCAVFFFVRSFLFFFLVLDQVGYIVFGLLDAVGWPLCPFIFVGLVGCGWPLCPFIFVGPVGCIVLVSLYAVDVGLLGSIYLYALESTAEYSDIIS